MKKRKMDHFADIEKVMLTIASDILRTRASLSTDLPTLQEEATGVLITQILDQNIDEKQEQVFPEKQKSHIILKGYRFSTEEIGKLYEHLRGYKFVISNGNNIKLTPSVSAKRNQGLFYTPEPIVKHIVTGTLDALGISNPEDYLDVKILDPAMGTGVFLAEALDQLIKRAMQAECSILEKKIEITRSALDDVFDLRDLLQKRDSDIQGFVKAHIFINCIYGVDLDPIAVRIGKAVLCEKVFGWNVQSSQIQCNLRAGNSLKGTICGQTGSLSKADEDSRHAQIYFGKKELNQEGISSWSEMKRIFHWPLEYPEVFSQSRSGFDAVIGNPPYEIVSVKESGITERKRDQPYYRATYRACQGKINTYRLMMERGLDLLKPGGVLGFIVPATLLADTTATHLRRIILNESEIVEAMVIPERARVFTGVTQALMIVLTRKGRPSSAVELSFWEDNAVRANKCNVRITRKTIQDIGLRVPLVRGKPEAKLLEALGSFPPLGGNEDDPPVCRVHQGEINLTVHADYLSYDRTDHPLIRGEHVHPFQVVHPTPGRTRLDWVTPKFFDKLDVAQVNRGPSMSRNPQRSRRGVANRNPWELWRIVLARVVNMGTYRRLKAAVAPPGYLVGDMTNFIIDIDIPFDYLLGVLNSRLLNWRIRITSTNNYVSASEILALPVPRVRKNEANSAEISYIRTHYEELLSNTINSIPEGLRLLKDFLLGYHIINQRLLLVDMLEYMVQQLVLTKTELVGRRREQILRVLDGLVLILYKVDSYAEIVEDRQPTGLA